MHPGLRNGRKRESHSYPRQLYVDIVTAGCRIPWFDAMVRAQLAREDTLVVAARDKEEAALLGLAVFTMESRSAVWDTNCYSLQE